MIRREDAAHLWHQEIHGRSLGCVNCPELPHCGGLSMTFPAISCLEFCCGKPSVCDLVCPSNPTFVARMQEVKGLDLRVPQATPVRHWALPLATPRLYHRYRRVRRLHVGAVALSLYDVIRWSPPGVKYRNRAELAARYGFDPGAQIILDGVARDAPLERFWGSDMGAIIEALRTVSPDLVTTPNFSLFTDQPRWTNLVNLKRIAIVWYELASRGLPTALHINAITDRDYERLTEFLVEHEEIRAISFEFGTGAGSPIRAPWHVENLCRLAVIVRHPLRLVVRGGMPHLGQLAGSFDALTVIDTNSFTKMRQRRSGHLASDGRLNWVSAKTRRNELLDELLTHNVQVMTAAIERAVYGTFIHGMGETNATGGNARSLRR